MNLAFVLFTFFPFGGLTRDMLAIARECRARGHRVRVYAGECRGDAPADIDLHIIPASTKTGLAPPAGPVENHLAPAKTGIAPPAGPAENHLASPPAASASHGPPPPTGSAENHLTAALGQNPDNPLPATAPIQNPARLPALGKNLAALGRNLKIPLTNPGKNRRFAAQLSQAVAEFAPHLVVGFNKMPGLDLYYAADDCFADKCEERGWLYQLTPRARQAVAFERAVFGVQSSTDIMLIAPKQLAVFRRFYGTPDARMTLLPPGISRDRIAGDDENVALARRRNFRRQWRLNDDDILLLAVGSGYQTKGVDRTLAAFASLPSAWRERAHLFIVGVGKAPPLEKMARRLGVHSRVRFTGGRTDVPEFLLAADVLIHPARQEAGGIVLLEALVAGLPVIATDVCGYAPYLTQAGLGCVLASPFEQPALNRALREFVERIDTDRDNWRAHGREFAAAADIYDMPRYACGVIEGVGERRGRS